MNRIIKNFSYTLVSNIIALVISTVVTFIVPKVLGVETYSYFQLYLFYVNYIGFLHLGWADGLYLRYGGSYYSDLDKNKISGQFWLLLVFEIIVSFSLALFSFCSEMVVDRKIVLLAISISIFIHLPRTLLQYVLQGTNRIKEYATLTISDKAIYIIIIILVLLLGTDSYVPIIVADLLGKLGALLYAIYQCRDIVFVKIEMLSDALIEAKNNIVVGSKLMFANLASMLIVGIVRFAIENQWDVAIFGKVSLTISVSNLLMIFIRAISMILFPMLRRTENNKLASIYNIMRNYLMMCLLGMLIFYYPIKVVLSWWLPQYAESLEYMAILFPMCIYESKMSMLVETYMKTLRKEKQLLMVNVITVIISAITTVIFAYGLHSLDLAVTSILMLLMFRCIFAEVLLSKSMDISVKKDICYEVILTIIFVIASCNIGGIPGLGIYSISYFVYLLFKRSEIRSIADIVYIFLKQKK